MSWTRLDDGGIVAVAKRTSAALNAHSLVRRTSSTPPRSFTFALLVPYGYICTFSKSDILRNYIITCLKVNYYPVRCQAKIEMSGFRVFK